MIFLINLKRSHLKRVCFVDFDVLRLIRFFVNSVSLFYFTHFRSLDRFYHSYSFPLVVVERFSFQKHILLFEIDDNGITKYFLYSYTSSTGNTSYEQ